MALVILSAGNLAASRVRTVTTRTIALGVGLLLLATLATGVVGGLALGYRLADRGGGPAGDPAANARLDPARPENQALIDRIGTLSARLLRLESEALTLAKRVGLMNEAEQRLKPGAGDTGSEPSGGPLLEPDDSTDVVVQSDVHAGLARLESGLDSLDASLALVSRRTADSDLAEMAWPSRYPIAGARISSRFGNRRDPFTGQRARHPGVDMPAPRGTPILASAGGMVRFAGFRRAYGNSVEIDHGDGLVTRYAHASKVLVRRGQVVLPEQVIATVGSTGRSTGPHLHFEVLQRGRPVEPLRYLERPGR
ncbi:MAG: M23 family metallopeptidase [Chromatiales bacterium]|nr:M23 family metallopeptidase [Chromatiales bacterium]